ncbi:MAG: hypothetical protein WEB58_22725 [Planctomycetaceae bacterium]
MSSRWVTGICLGGGLALIASGIAQTVFVRTPARPHGSNRGNVPLPVDPATAAAIDAVNEFFSAPPPGDQASPEDLELTNEFSRALKDRSGVSVSRSAHNGASVTR